MELDFEQLQYEYYIEHVSDIGQFIDKETERKLIEKYGENFWIDLTKDLCEDDDVYWKINKVIEDSINKRINN